MGRALEITSAEGIIDAHIFTPDSASGPLPAVVLFTDIGGLRPCYHEKAQNIADSGYAVLMPNVYYRDQAGPVVPDGKSFRDDDVRPTLFEYAGHLTPAAQADDFETLLAAIDAEAEFADGPIGVVGYCMTGAFALRMAANHPDRIGAAAGFHSARLAAEDDANSPMHLVDQIRARVFLGHADGDELMPPEQIGRLDQAMAAAALDFTTELFKGAAHGYTAKDAPVYNAEADARHYKRLLTLFEETLSKKFVFLPTSLADSGSIRDGRQQESIEPAQRHTRWIAIAMASINALRMGRARPRPTGVSLAASFHRAAGDLFQANAR